METTAAAIVIGLAGLIGVAVTLLGLSGAWLIVAAALIVEWQAPGTFSWWTLAAAGALALLGEIIEFASGSIGATKAGGTKRAALGALFGGIVGGILATPILPIVGTILGAAAGAGLGAALADRTREARKWKESARVAGGAAVGRLVATIVKTALTALQAVVLFTAVFVR
ncbi:MAG: DUF456 domain-containing protein [Phycisphaerales bacterium]